MKVLSLLFKFTLMVLSLNNVEIMFLKESTLDDFRHSENNFQSQKGRVQYPATRRMLNRNPDVVNNPLR